MLLSESKSSRTGRGFYAFRPTVTLPVAIQAPHSFADRHTRVLTARLFLGGPFAAAAWNTVHRRVADVAHTDSSFLNAFTRALATVYGEDVIVCQLHGFSKAKRTTATGRMTDLIVSNGSKLPGLWLHRTRTRLRNALPGAVVTLYPEEVLELGATTNRQARVLREVGVGKFLHLEMSAELRASLLDQPAQQSKLLKALENAFRTECRGCTETNDQDGDADDRTCTGARLYPHDLLTSDEDRGFARGVHHPTVTVFHRGRAPSA